MQGIKCMYHNAVGTSGPRGKDCSLQKRVGIHIHNKSNPMYGGLC